MRRGFGGTRRSLYGSRFPFFLDDLVRDWPVMTNVLPVSTVPETAGDALWHNTDVPTDTQVEADTTPVVVGTRFTVDANSTLVAIRYFRPPVYDSSYTLELRVHKEA